VLIYPVNTTLAGIEVVLHISKDKNGLTVRLFDCCEMLDRF